MTTTEKQIAMLELSRLYGDYCCFCGGKDDLTIDHIYPQCAGGSNDLSNLQILCRECNSRKSDWVFQGTNRVSKDLTNKQLERSIEDDEIILKERALLEFTLGWNGTALDEYMTFLYFKYRDDITESRQELTSIPF